MNGTKRLLSLRKAFLIALTVATSASAAPVLGAVEIEKSDDSFIVRIGQQEFARFDTGQNHSRPYFAEIRAENGALLTRPISPPGGDHPHHTGVWIAVDKVNGVGFWHQEGRIENQSTEVVQSGSNPAVLKLHNLWFAPDGTPLLHEHTTICIFENRLLTYDIQFTAKDTEVTFGDTEEGFFAFRMADSMREEATGQVVNADGLKTAKGCWGKPSRWVDYSGQVDGATFGVAIFDYPLNFRPGRYHVRDYGLFTISPFGEHDYTEGQLPVSPVTLKAGSSLRLRYGVYFHKGDVDTGNVSKVYQLFLSVAGDEPNREQEIQYRSSADGTVQPAMYCAPSGNEEVPLLVALHTWSGDYQQDYHASCKQWCQDKCWAYIHPNFRGPNKRPEATGSELVVQDIVDAVRFASQHANVDPRRVYLVGTSGGGYTALLMAGRHPDVWAGVSAWVPIVDLARWYHQSKSHEDEYWQDVAASCGGPPGANDEVDRQYALRSPITWLRNARSLNLDINAGIRDGHEGSVPVSHSLRAFNEVASIQDRLTEEEIAYFVREAKVPAHLKQQVSDESYEEKRPLFRRHSGRARVTLFDGGHELVPQAALTWLEKQRLVTPSSPGTASTQSPR